jgi:hypothetical protein
MLHGLTLAMEIAIRFLDQVIDDQMTHGQVKRMKVMEESIREADAQSFGDGHNDVGGPLAVADEIQNFLRKFFPALNDLQEGPFALS